MSNDANPSAAAAPPSLRSLVKLLLILVALWVLRVIVAFVDVGRFFPNSKLFDMDIYTNPFPLNFLKTPFQFSLTAACLGISMLALALWASIHSFQIHGFLGRVAAGKPLKRIAAALVALTILAVPLHSVSASFKTLVVESTGRFFDPGSIFPPYPAWLMLLTLIFEAAAALMMCAIAFNALARLLQGNRTGSMGPVALASAIIFLFALTLTRAQFLAASTVEVLILLLTIAAAARLTLRETSRIWGAILLFPLLAVTFSFPFLNHQLAVEQERAIRQRLQQNTLPTREWLDATLGEGLDGISSSPLLAKTLQGQVPPSAAYRQWLQSDFSRLDCPSFVQILSNEGKVLSTFSVGMPPQEKWVEKHEMSDPTEWTVPARPVRSGPVEWEVYLGKKAVESEDEKSTLGWVLAAICPWVPSGRMARLPAFLESPEKASRRLPALEFAEFDGWKTPRLYRSTNPTLAAGLTPPRFASNTVDDKEILFAKRDIGGESYDCYFLRRNVILAGTSGKWAAQETTRTYCLYTKSKTLTEHVADAARLLLMSGAIFFGLAAVWLVWQILRGRIRLAALPNRLQGRLILAFGCLSLVPLLALAILTRTMLREQEIGEYARNLNDASEIADRLLTEKQVLIDTSTREPQLSLTDDDCRQVAAVIGTDVIVFVDGKMKVSSRPELFDPDKNYMRTGLSSEARQALGTSREASVNLRQQVKGENYWVGYRRASFGGRIDCVIAVPMFNRDPRTREATTRLTVLALGACLLLFVLTAWLAASLARLISHPIESLTERTRRIADGDLDSKVGIATSGELKELVESFDTMTEQLKQSREKLAKAERETAWRDMAKRIAHEIKNPLTPMKLCAQQIAQAYSDRNENFPKILDSSVNTIVRQVELLGRIATEFSYFARLPERHPMPCPMNTTLEETLGLFAGGLPANVKLVKELSQDIPVMMLDRDEMIRVFSNLTKNALQAMPDGGTLTVSTRVVRGDQAKGQWVEVSFADTGMGISEENKANIFLPYFSTKAEGTGLGLAICKKIVDEIGGEIVVDSTEGKGSTFTVRLPAR